MQVIRQHHRSHHLERPSGMRLAKGRSQQVDVIHQQPRVTLQQIDG
jgi:hypothetical protein